MVEERVQRATSTDGTEIAARIHGQGPPLVLFPGGFGDGETNWATLLPELVDRFSCYAFSPRGRGLSGPGDLAPERSLDDGVCLIESIGEPVATFSLSGGGLFLLGAAERTDAIHAAVAYEPPVFSVMDEDVADSFFSTIAETSVLAEQGRLADAAGHFLALVTNDEEKALIAGMDLHDMCAPNVEVQLAEFAALADHDGPLVTDAQELGKIRAPLLLLHGTASALGPWFPDGIRHLAEHVPNTRVRAVEGAGHLGPLVHPAAVAREIEAFLTTVGASA